MTISLQVSANTRSTKEESFTLRAIYDRWATRKRRLHCGATTKSNGSKLGFQKYHSCEIPSYKILFCNNLVNPDPAVFTPGKADCILPSESS